MKYASPPVQEKWAQKEVGKIKREFEKNKDQLIKRGEAKGKKQGRIEGAKTREMQIAKQMLRKGIDTKLIKEITGITPQWIGRLKGEIEKEKKEPF